MPDEEPKTLSVEDSFKASLPAGLAGGIIGAVIGVVLSLFAIFNIGFQGLFASLILATFGFIVGFIAIYLITFIWYILPEWLKKPVTYLFVLVIIIGVIWAGIFLWKLPLTSEYLKFASPMFDSVGKGWHDLRTNWGACFYLKPPCPFLIDWEAPDVQSAQEELRVDVSFSENRIVQNRVNLGVSITVINPELAELKVTPKCYLGKDKRQELRVENMGTYAFGDEFVFGTTQLGEELHTSLRCVGDIYDAADKQLYSDYVVVELERPVTVKTTWPVHIGQEPKIGLVRSSMQFNAPYSIAMASNNDMPFNEGKDYEFTIVLKKRAEDVKLKELNYMNLKFTDDIMIQCEGFQGIDHELEIKDYSYGALRNSTQYDSTYDKFSWPCQLYVSSAPRTSVLTPVVLESKYIVYSTYSARIIKSP